MNRKEIYARRKAEIAELIHIELDLDAVTVFVQQAPYRAHHMRAIITEMTKRSEQTDAHRVLWNAATHGGQSYADAVRACQAIEFEPIHIAALEPIPEDDPWADFEGIRLFENDEEYAAASLADEMADDDFEPLVVLASAG